MSLRSAVVALFVVAVPALSRAAPPSPVDNLVEEGSRKLQAGDDAGAIAVFDRAQKEAPRDPRPRYLRGAALAHQNKHELAVAAFREALALDPKLPEVHNELGAALEELEKLDDAVREFAAAAALKPELSEAWFNQGRILLERKHDTAAAIKVLSDGIKAVPRDQDLHVELSTALRHAKRYAEGLTEARAAIALGRGNADAQLNLGLALQSVKQLDEAAAALTTATRLSPSLSAAWWGLGEVERERKRLPAAIAALQQAEKLKPAPGTSVTLAETLRESGDVATAEKVLRAAQLRAPRSLAVRVELVRVLLQANKCLPAQDAIKDLPKQHPEIAAVAKEVAAKCKP
jgi:tetratricopeptide (TPR) repeat protein